MPAALDASLMRSAIAAPQTQPQAKQEIDVNLLDTASIDIKPASENRNRNKNNRNKNRKPNPNQTKDSAAQNAPTEKRTPTLIVPNAKRDEPQA